MRTALLALFVLTACTTEVEVPELTGAWHAVLAGPMDLPVTLYLEESSGVVTGTSVVEWPHSPQWSTVLGSYAEPLASLTLTGDVNWQIDASLDGDVLRGRGEWDGVEFARLNQGGGQ